jgi:hypothetical protein
LSALRHLLEVGAEVRGIKNLHAKVYVFGMARSMVTSANLTEAGLTRNHELGFISDEPSIVSSCREYFEKLWTAAKESPVLTSKLIDQWEEKLRPLADKKHGPYPSLPDFGANLGFVPPPIVVTEESVISTQAFVKFLGKTDDRADLADAVSDQVIWSEANWAVSYPNGKRPRKPKTGDVMFLGRMVHSPNDTIIFGRAIAYKHEPDRDDATVADKKRCTWRNEWPHYIRLRDPEFIDGSLHDGLSLKELMSEFKSQSFVSTSENARLGRGNVDPSMSIRQKPDVRLSTRAGNWLNAKFYEAVKKHGRVPLTELKNLYWPDFLPSL